MVAVHSSAIFGPLSGPDTREKIRTALSRPLSPKAMNIPAMISAATKTRNPTPTPAIVPNRLMLTPFN